METLLAAAPAERIAPQSDSWHAIHAADARSPAPAEPTFREIHSVKAAPSQPSGGSLRQTLAAVEHDLDHRKPVAAPHAPVMAPTLGKTKPAAARAAHPDNAPPKLTFTYSPIWSAQKKAVISYQLNMAMQSVDGTDLDPADAFGGEDDINLIRTVDRLVVKRGLADLSRAIAANRKYIACLPVTSYSLLEQWGTPTIFDAALAGLPSPYPQLIVLDVVDAQVLERRDLVQCATAATAKCRYLLLRASLDQTNFAGLAHPNVRAIGGSLRDHAWSEKDAAKKLDSFVTSTVGARLETFLFGIHSRSMAFAAIAAGFDYVSGPAIAPTLDEAGGVSPIDMLGLFK